MTDYWNSIHISRFPDDDAPRMPQAVADAYRAFVSCGLVGGIATTAAITDPGSEPTRPPMFMTLFHSGGGYHLGALIVSPENLMRFVPLIALADPSPDEEETVATISAIISVGQKVAEICAPIQTNAYLSHIYIGEPNGPANMALAEAVGYLSAATMMAVMDTMHDATQAELLEQDTSAFPYLRIGHNAGAWFLYACLPPDCVGIGMINPSPQPDAIDQIRALSRDYFDFARQELDSGDESEYN